MNHSSHNVRRSILTKFLFGSVLILLAVGGMAFVSFFSFQHVETLLLSIIDTKVSQAIQNAELERELSTVFAETNLLISNFIEQDQEQLQQQGNALIENVQSNLTTRTVTGSEELHTVLQQFSETLQLLLDHCLKMTQLYDTIQTTATQLAQKLKELEDLVSEKMLMLAMQGENGETFSLEQLVSMIPEYQNFLSQVNIQLMKSTQANLGLQFVENSYQETFISLLTDYKAALGVITTSGQDFEPFGEDLLQLVSVYQEQILEFHQEMREFQDRLTQLKETQQQVKTQMAQIEMAISQATETIRQEATAGIQSSRTLIVSFSLLIMAILMIAGYYALRMIRPIASLARTANQLAQGDMTFPPSSITSQDEIGVLAASFRNMVAYVRDIANVTENIAEGNLQVNVRPRSQKDVLNISFQKLVLYIQDVARVMQKISQKDLEVTVTPKSEHDVLNTSLQQMVKNLRTMMHEIDRQTWIKDGVNQLNIELSGGMSLREVCDKAVGFLARYLKAGQGVLYTYNSEQEHLKLAGSFAFTERDEVSIEYRLGEGIIGQVALEREPILLKHPSREESVITTGTFSGSPLNTYTFPLVYENELYGVVELASFEPFDEMKQAFLQEVIRIIATAIFSAVQRERVQELLQHSQQETED